MMDQCEEDRVVLQSVQPTESMDQAEDKEQPTQSQKGDGGDEWDTDLETDSKLQGPVQW